jgi:hypothetical protein
MINNYLIKAMLAESYLGSISDIKGIINETIKLFYLNDSKSKSTIIKHSDEIFQDIFLSY